MAMTVFTDGEVLYVDGEPVADVRPELRNTMLNVATLLFYWLEDKVEVRVDMDGGLFVTSQDPWED